MKKLMVVCAVVMLAASGVTAASLSVNGTAAIEGSYGLQVLMDGVADSAYVLDGSPTNETVYRAMFKINWNTVHFAAHDNGPLSSSAIFKGWDMDQPAGEARQHTVVGLRYDLAGNRRLWLKVSDMVGGVPVGRYTEWGMPSSAGGYPVTVLVQFNQAANEVELCRQNAFVGATMVCSTVSANISALNVDQVTFGATGGVDAASSGSYFLDSFESYRTLAP